MKHTISTLFLFLTLTGILSSQTTVTDKINHQGRERDFRLFIPSTYEASNEPLALVFNMHGFTSNASQQEQFSEMNSVAEQENFLVCYPNGVNRAWNVGWSFGSTADDVDFISTLIDYLADRYAIDISRVYACGMSNGGFMSFELACRLSDKIAAVASVTGSMVPQALANCQPENAVPVLQIHGTQDFVVNYNGSNIAAPILDVINFWIQNNGCQKNAIESQWPNINTDDNTTTDIFTYTSCNNDAEVVHFKVNNGGHTWPRLNATTVGTSRDFEASKVIWDFFKKYTLKQSSALGDLEELDGHIFPNPFFDKIYLEAPSDLEVIVYDGLGRCQLITSLTNGQNTLPTASWKPGFYIVFLKQNGRQKYFKMLKPY